MTIGFGLILFEWSKLHIATTVRKDILGVTKIDNFNLYNRIEEMIRSKGVGLYVA